MHAAKFGEDEHQQQREDLFRQIACATQELQEITPVFHGLNSLLISPFRISHVTVDFSGTELDNSAGPTAYSDPFAEPANCTCQQCRVYRLREHRDQPRSHVCNSDTRVNSTNRHVQSSRSEGGRCADCRNAFAICAGVLDGASRLDGRCLQQRHSDRNIFTCSSSPTSSCLLRLAQL